jgi:PAS domain S-box-containing protein
MLQLIMNNIPQGIFWKDRNSRYVGCNKVFAKAAGVESPENIVGKTDYDLPWSREQTEWFLEYDRRIMENGTPEYHIVEPHRKADGELAWVETNKVPLHDAKGNVMGILGTYEDITERKRAEEALRLSSLYNRSLIEASLDPLVTIGRDGKITDVNKATEQVTGYSRNYLIGTDFSDYFTEPEKAREGYQQVFTEGEVRDYPLEIQHKEGYITPVLYNASIYRGENGEVIGVFAAARDITESKEAEEAIKNAYDNLEQLVEERTSELEKAYNSLKESEKGLAEAQKMAHIGNWNWNIVTNGLYWSDEIYRIFGCSPQEFGATYDAFLSYVHPDDREYVNNAVIEALNGKSYSIDHRIILASEEERVVHEQGEVIFNDENIPIRMIGTVQDITGLKKAEERIQNLANIVESSNDAIGTIALEGALISWNIGAEDVYGYSVEEILGKHVSTLAPPHLDKETIKLIEKIKQGKKVQRYETLRLRKDGMTINVSITLSPVFDALGKLTAISFITRDVTKSKEAEEKLRESEEKYRNIVETANEGILITDNESVATYVNERFADMLRYTPEELIGRSTWDLISEEYKPVVELNLEKRRQGISNSYGLKLIRKDGYPIWTIINAKPLFENDGRYIGAMSMFTDITKWKEAEEALANIQIARQKEIHHRIKNNLQVISSLLDLQSEMFRNRECVEEAEVLKAFKESQDRVMSIALIHEELHEGRGTDKLNFSTYLERLVKNLFQTYRLGNTNTSLNIELEDNIFFDMDIAVPLGIIINELVSNSLKYAFPGKDKGEIQIKLCKEKPREYTDTKSESEKEDFDYINFVLTVSDNGVGIPESFNSESSDSLGLQLVAILVDQLDGELELRRSNGTEFAIRFTIAEKNNQASTPAPQLVK